MINRIFSEQLLHSLSNKLQSIYCLVGTDPLLLSDSKDAIQQAAFKQGFDEKTEIQVDQSTQWNNLFEQTQSMGLFFNKQIISLILPENITLSIQKHLQTLISLLSENILLILQLPKLSKITEKQSWFSQISNAMIVNCQTPSIEQLPLWIQQRAKTMALVLDNESMQLLCYSYENNLLALKQVLQLLALLYPDHKLTYPRVKKIVEQSSVFTPFQWIDALLEGKEARAQRILTGLQQEEVQSVVLLRLLQRELMIILELVKPQQKTTLDSTLSTKHLREGFDELKVWKNRRTLFTAFIQRHTYRKLYSIFQELAEIERAVKQEFSHTIWQQLENLSVKICQ